MNRQLVRVHPQLLVQMYRFSQPSRYLTWKIISRYVRYVVDDRLRSFIQWQSQRDRGLITWLSASTAAFITVRRQMLTRLTLKKPQDRKVEGRIICIVPAKLTSGLSRDFTVVQFFSQLSIIKTVPCVADFSANLVKTNATMMQIHC